MNELIWFTLHVVISQKISRKNVEKIFKKILEKLNFMQISSEKHQAAANRCQEQVGTFVMCF